MAIKSKKRKGTKPQAYGFEADGVPMVVDALPADDPSKVDIRALLRPARSLSGDAEHYKKLDGAMDNAFVGGKVLNFEFSALSSFVSFVGYGVLQQLSQDALVRLCVQTRTDEMLRSWIDIKCTDEERKKRIQKAIEKKRIRETLSKALTTMGFMGGCFLYIDTGNVKPEEILNRTSSSKEVLNGNFELRVIDPIFSTPQSFNASDPLSDDFYQPSVFIIMGKPVHRSRLIRFVENEVPDLLKPSYNFFGIAQAQLLSDYVTHFRKNREEVNSLLKKFSTSFIKGNLKSQLFSKASWSAISKRAEYFAKFRDNNGIGFLDKDSEDFIQVNTPITGLTDIVRQSLEFVVSVNQSGVVKTLGYTPNGFNSGESDVKLQADLIATRQEKILRQPISEILELIQIEEFGDVDPELTFVFNPLDEDDERVKAEVAKLAADTSAVYLDRGVLTEDEVREVLRQDENHPFGVLEGEAPGAPEDPFAQMSDPTEQTTEVDDVDKAGAVY